MDQRRVDTTRGFAAGLLAGAAIGAGVALLTAPRSGRALRRGMRHSMLGFREVFGERSRELADRASEEWDGIRRVVREKARAIDRAMT